MKSLQLVLVFDERGALTFTSAPRHVGVEGWPRATVMSCALQLMQGLHLVEMKDEALRERLCTGVLLPEETPADIVEKGQLSFYELVLDPKLSPNIALVEEAEDEAYSFAVWYTGRKPLKALRVYGFSTLIQVLIDKYIETTMALAQEAARKRRGGIQIPGRDNNGGPQVIRLP